MKNKTFNLLFAITFIVSIAFSSVIIWGIIVAVKWLISQNI